MSITVLVVQDQWNLRKLAALALQTSGYNVIEAENGEQAIELLATSHIDLILTDWSMPVMNGQEMLETIQRQQKDSDLPVVVLSSLQSSCCSVREKKSLGILSWLQKPCRISTLRNTVADILALKCQSACH